MYASRTFHISQVSNLNIGTATFRASIVIMYCRAIIVVVTGSGIPPHLLFLDRLLFDKEHG